MKKYKYVIRSFWDTPYYFMSKSTTGEGGIKVKFSPKLDDAYLFSNILDAEITAELLRETSGDAFKIYPICPICGEDYSDPPAISRKDNKTKICPKCGTGEALIDFIDNLQKNKATN